MNPAPVTAAVLSNLVPDEHRLVLEVPFLHDARPFHMANLGDLGEAILATVSLVQGEVLGEPSTEPRENLADSPVQLFTPYQSM